MSHYLKNNHDPLFYAASAEEAFEVLGIGDQEAAGSIDLVLLDIMLPGIDGIETCKRIKEVEKYSDVPVIMVTARTDLEYIERAFNAGALDYIQKPVRKIELLARVNSALRLRREMKERREREEELEIITSLLEDANRELEKMASIDGLTGLANRMLFDKFLDREWKSALREDKKLALIMLDIDFFKYYNDFYGHQAGDECLKRLAKKLDEITYRPRDLAARYGGEEFAVIMPDTDIQGGIKVAERIRSGVESMEIPHEKSKVSGYVTVSVGVAIALPGNEEGVEALINASDQALYLAKNDGRNRVKFDGKVVN